MPPLGARARVTYDRGSSGECPWEVRVGAVARRSRWRGSHVVPPVGGRTPAMYDAGSSADRPNAARVGATAWSTLATGSQAGRCADGLEAINATIGSYRLRTVGTCA